MTFFIIVYRTIHLFEVLGAYVSPIFILMFLTIWQIDMMFAVFEAIVLSSRDFSLWIWLPLGYMLPAMLCLMKLNFHFEQSLYPLN